MELQSVPPSLSPNLKRHRYSKISSNTSWSRFCKLKIKICPNYRMYDQLSCLCLLQTTRRRKVTTWKLCAAKKGKCIAQLKEKPVKVSKEKGTIAGAVALIIGTSIGSGILALPKKTSPAGLLPSSISLIVCWAFLLIEALVLVEINVGLLKKKMRIDEEDELELEVISIRTMAQETLGEWGGFLATLAYVFLGYTSIIAYSSKSGEILYHLINLPESISGFLFTAFFTMLISIGGTRSADQVNQWLTASMIGLLVLIEVLAILLEGWSGFVGTGDWGKVPATIPVMIFSLVYHDLTPVLCAYLEGDLQRIRVSVLVGSMVPLLALLVWNAIALDLSAQSDQLSDPVELLMRVRWSGVSVMVEAFSLLAVGTSLIGTLLGFSQFFKEQLNNNNTFNLPPEQTPEKASELLGVAKWWGRNKVNLAATAMAIVPSLFVSTTFPDAFSAATDFAGGYCMTMLYGVLPPAMAWALRNRERDDDSDEISRARPALVGLGLFASGIVVEQVLQDFSLFKF
ncbi:hypothetical protein LguiA_023556 [Lonicera macranthoides]